MVELSKEEKFAALDLFEVPEKFRVEAMRMLTQQELELILLMKKEVIEAEELKKRIAQAGIAKAPESLIESAYSRAVLNKVRGENQELQYQITNLYARYPLYAQYEFEDYARIPRPRRELLNQWDFEIYFNECKDIVAAKQRGEDRFLHDGDFMTLEQACQAVMDHPDFIYRMPCNCKCMMDVTEKPRNVCISFCGGDNTHWDRGHGQRLTAEQACELLKQWNSFGLMPNGKPDEEGGFCNCDGGSCYPLQMARKMGSQGVYPRAYFKIHWNAEKCVSCGRCTKVCNFQAFTVGEDKKVTFDPAKCWGCTVCTNNCPTGAITKTPIE